MYPLWSQSGEPLLKVLGVLRVSAEAMADLLMADEEREKAAKAGKAEKKAVKAAKGKAKKGKGKDKKKEAAAAPMQYESDADNVRAALCL